MLFVGQGLTQVITNGYPIYPLPDVVGSFGQATGAVRDRVGLRDPPGPADCSAIRRCAGPRWGATLYATGGNKEVARLVGINTDRYKMVCFMLVSTLAAIAGMLVMGSLASATTSIGQGWELTVIAGVVVGGVSLFGGVGTVLGGALGMLLLQVVQSGLVVVGVSANWQQVSVGAIMVLAVGLDVFRRKLSFRQVQSVEDVTALLTDSGGRHGKEEHPWARRYRRGEPGDNRGRGYDGNRKGIIMIHARYTAPAGRAIGAALICGSVLAAGQGGSVAAASHLARVAGAGTLNFLWVQPLRNHPVHRLDAGGFPQRVQEAGLFIATWSATPAPRSTMCRPAWPWPMLPWPASTIVASPPTTPCLDQPVHREAWSSKAILSSPGM